MNSVTKKKKTITVSNLLKTPAKITLFNDIKSIKQEPLAISKSRTKVLLSSSGMVYAARANAYKSNIYSFEITPDIHKVVISNVAATPATLEKESNRILASISVRDIPDAGDANALKEELRAELIKYGYSKNAAEEELTGAATNIQDCADPFLGSNTLFMQSVLRISALADSNGTVEFIIPPGTFMGRKDKKVYLFVSSTTTPTVTPYTFPQDKPYFYLEPAAEALTVGDKLGNSKIMLGEVHLGKKTIAGIYLWKKPATKIKSNGEDVQTHPALFLPLEQPKFLKPAVTYLQTALAKKNPGTIASILEKMFKKIKLPLLNLKIYEAAIKVPVYVKNDKQFYSFVWRTNDLVKDEYVEKNIAHPRKHLTYQGLYDNFSIGQIYNSLSSFISTTTEYAIDQVVRGLLAQPTGKKSISIDGMVRSLIGGAILEGQELTFVSASAETKDTDFESKDTRLTRDYLYSMVYSGPADQSTKDQFSGEGYLFFDSPIHYNHPKVVLGRELDSDLVKFLKEKGDYSFVKYLVSLRLRTKRAKMLLSDYLNLGDPDDKNDSRPTSGCLALQALLKDIFTEVQRYGVNIDYVYSDLERICNTGWFLRAHNRINHRYEPRTYAPNLFNISLNKTNGVIDNQKMWNAICETERFQKEILPKLVSRGFPPYKEPAGQDDFYLSMVNQAFWRQQPAQRPNFGYWLAQNYATRRQLNIWDCVMTEYIAELQQTFVMDIFTKINPKVKYSTYAQASAKGHTHYGAYGLYLEPSLGGSISLPKTMSSSASLYGGSIPYGHCKFNLDDYRCYIEDKSAFAFFRDEINRIRADKSNNPNGIMPFYSCQYYRKYHDPAFDQNTFYKDILFHTWMCQPDQMIAYFNYDSTIKSAFEKEDSKDHRKDYFRQCYQDTQKILDELNSIIKDPIVKTLNTNLVNECDPFVLTGIETKTDRIWRFTFNVAKKASLKKEKNNVIISVSKKVISFANATVLKKDPTGCWIKAPKKTNAGILSEKDFFETAPAYYVEKPFEKQPDPFIAFDADRFGHCKHLFWHAQGTMVFGENAPDQIWEAKIMFDKITPNSRIFKINVSELEGVKVGVWYTFTAKVSCPRPTFIFGETGSDKDKRVEITLTYQGDGVTRTKKYSFERETPYKPITYFELGQNASGKETDTIHCEYFKILVDGKNIRADIFRESDGVNITRVNRGISEFKDYNLKNTPCTEPFEIKVSWLNATNKPETYTVWIESVKNMLGHFSSQKKIATVKVNANDQGYMVLPEQSVNRGIKSIAVIIKDSKNNIVFKATSIVAPLIRL